MIDHKYNFKTKSLLGSWGQPKIRFYSYSPVFCLPPLSYLLPDKSLTLPGLNCDQSFVHRNLEESPRLSSPSSSSIRGFKKNRGEDLVNKDGENTY